MNPVRCVAGLFPLQGHNFCPRLPHPSHDLAICIMGMMSIHNPPTPLTPPMSPPPTLYIPPMDPNRNLRCLVFFTSIYNGLF